MLVPQEKIILVSRMRLVLKAILILARSGTRKATRLNHDEIERRWEKPLRVCMHRKTKGTASGSRPAQVK